MKTIDVAAAIIFRNAESAGTAADQNANGAKNLKLEVFSTQRGYGEWKGWWEFPGGKIEAGESPEAALVREIQEELCAKISIKNLFAQIEYDYPKFRLNMKCYECRLKEKTIRLLEHQNALWLSAKNVRTVKWLPADELVLPKVEARLAQTALL